MENTNNYFEGIAELTTLETQHSNLNLQAFNSTEPKDEDEGEEETEDEGGDKSEKPGDDNPPLDKDIVHSPLTPQTGGKPSS